MENADRRALCFVSHVISQLTYRWRPVAHLPGIQTGRDLGEIPDSEWERLVRDSIQSGLVEILSVRAGTSYRKLEMSDVMTAIRDELRSVGAAGAKHVLYCDTDYPQLLRLLPDPPSALTVIGDISSNQSNAISVIGSRKASERSWHQSYHLGQALAELGLTVISGGAYGCDIAAHLGVLHSGRDRIQAVVVQAGGLGKLYPARHVSVFRHLVAKGAAICSERLWNTPAMPYSFPVRNRIIAGLAGETVIMQAGGRSGALTTARLALDYGREVSVLSHDRWDVRAQGSHELIDSGAPAFVDFEQYVDRFNG